MSIPSTPQQIADKNREYRNSLERLHDKLIEIFDAKGNARAKSAMESDEELGLATLFYIMFTSCGGVEISGGVPSLVPSGQESYDKWDGAKMCLASQLDFLAVLAMEIAPMPEDGFYLCSPGVLSDSDVELFEEAFDVAYTEHGENPVFSYGRLGKTPVVPVPDWARYLLAQNAFDMLAREMINSHVIFCLSNTRSYGMNDDLPRNSAAMVRPLLCGRNFAADLFEPPSSLLTVETWRREALSPRFALSNPDEEMNKIYQIYMLWTEICKSLSVASVIRADKLTDADELEIHLRNLGECICAPAAVDALLSGVPIEDILA